jgi:hypothetical protein
MKNFPRKKKLAKQAKNNEEKKMTSKKTYNDT